VDLPPSLRLFTGRPTSSYGTAGTAHWVTQSPLTCKSRDSQSKPSKDIHTTYKLHPV
jgi:hypothetical protein